MYIYISLKQKRRAVFFCAPFLLCSISAFLLYKSAFLKQQLNIGALHLLHYQLEHFLFGKGQLYIGNGLFINGIVAGSNSLTSYLLPHTSGTARSISSSV